MKWNVLMPAKKLNNVKPDLNVGLAIKELNGKLMAAKKDGKSFLTWSPHTPDKMMDERAVDFIVDMLTKYGYYVRELAYGDITRYEIYWEYTRYEHREASEYEVEPEVVTEEIEQPIEVEEPVMEPQTEDEWAAAVARFEKQMDGARRP